MHRCGLSSCDRILSLPLKYQSYQRSSSFWSVIQPRFMGESLFLRLGPHFQAFTFTLSSRLTYFITHVWSKQLQILAEVILLSEQRSLVRATSAAGLRESGILSPAQWSVELNQDWNPNPRGCPGLTFPFFHAVHPQARQEFPSWKSSLL